MRVKLLKAWRGWKPGHAFTGMTEPVAKVLAQRGIGEIVDDLPEDKPDKKQRPKRGAGHNKSGQKAPRANRKRNASR